MLNPVQLYSSVPLFERRVGPFEEAAYQPKLWTLQMIRYRTEELFQVMRELERIEVFHRDQSDIFPYREVKETEKTQLNGLLIGRLLGEFSELGMLDLVSHIGGIETRLSETYLSSSLHVELRSLREAVDLWITKCVFLLLDEGKDSYYQKPALFGKSVNQVFPDAAKDIQEAGNCYATGNYTAAVFHLMRVVGVGLRALAQHQKIKDTVPLELQEWKTLIDGIDKTVKETVERWPKSQEKDETLRFFADAIGEIRGYKDELRNPLSHRTVHYNETDAKAALDRVQNFMRRLVKYFPEGL